MRCEPPRRHPTRTKPGATERGQGPRPPLGSPGCVGRSAVGRWRVVAAPAPLRRGRRPSRPAGLAGHPQVKPVPGPGGRRHVRCGAAGLAAGSPLVVHPACGLAGSGRVAGRNGLSVPMAAGDGHQPPWRSGSRAPSTCPRWCPSARREVWTWSGCGCCPVRPSATGPPTHPGWRRLAVHSTAGSARCRSQKSSDVTAAKAYRLLRAVLNTAVREDELRRRWDRPEH
jgi:hypothetical protein